MQSPTPDLLFQSLHFNKITGDVGGCYSVRSTRTETQIWPRLSPAFKPLRAVSAQGSKPKLLLTFKALSDSTSIYLPCQLSLYPYVPATPNPSWHPALPCAPLPTCLMPLWPAFVMHPDDQFQEWALPSTSFMKPMWLNLPRGNLPTVLIPTKFVSGPPSELCAFNPYIVTYM